VKTLAKRKSRRQQADRMRLASRQKRMLNAKKKGKPEIPTNVLRALSALGLPRDENLYTKCVNALCAIVAEAEAR